MPVKSKKAATTIDGYLADLPAGQRAALEKLRAAIRAIAPDAEECITYQIPAFRLNGKSIAGFSASKNHCTFFPMSGGTVALFQDELRGFDTSKGAIRFQPDKPIPAPLLRKLVKSRIRDIEEGRR
jgi:uncharacterized protein YdhG (YjbR/CyaY superfamily)